MSWLFPIIAFNLVNYIAGLTGITWWIFGWTADLGILPLTFLMVMLGDWENMLLWYFWMMFIVVGFSMWLALRFRRAIIAWQR